MADFQALVTADISQAQSQLNQLKSEIQALGKNPIKPKIDMPDTKPEAEKMTKTFNSALTKIKAETLSNKIEAWATKNSAALEKMGADGTALKTQLEGLKGGLNGLEDASKLSKISAEFNNIKSTVEKYKASVKEAADVQQTLSKSSTLSNNIETWMNKNKKAAKEYADELKHMQDGLKNNKDPEVLKNTAQKFNEIKAAAAAASSSTSSFFGNMKSLAGQVVGITSTYAAIQKVIGFCKEGIQAVQELDEALTNVSYTMNVSDSDLANIGQGAMQMAEDLNTSATSVLDAVKLYANANETMESILAKAKVATMLGNVTGMSGSESAKMMQSVMNQFDMDQSAQGLESSLYRVSDVLQAVSRNMSYDFADGIKQMSSGIEASGAVANNAGLSLEQYSSMIGLLVEKTGQMYCPNM